MLFQAQKLKVLQIEKCQLLELNESFAIEDLRVMHLVECDLSDISSHSLKVFKAAKDSLRSVNLSKNRITTIPDILFDHCPYIVKLLLAQN